MITGSQITAGIRERLGRAKLQHKKPVRGFMHESTHNESKEWYTPKAIFDALGLEFDLDAASPGKDKVPWIPAKRHYTVSDDGLKSPWGEGRVWCNPPYGADTPAWVEKFADHGNGVMLVFARVDTQWFHKHAVRCDSMLFCDGRIKFISAKENDGTGDSGASGPGAGSMLLASGRECIEALQRSGLGFFIVLPRRPL